MTYPGCVTCHLSVLNVYILTSATAKMQDFEELISSTNMLNRKLEDVVGMRKEIDPIADLWSSFYQLMREQKPDVVFGADGQGIPGTGGHVVIGNGAES
jgi:DASH complex subunit Dad1